MQPKLYRRDGIGVRVITQLFVRSFSTKKQVTDNTVCSPVCSVSFLPLGADECETQERSGGFALSGSL